MPESILPDVKCRDEEDPNQPRVIKEIDTHIIIGTETPKRYHADPDIVGQPLEARKEMEEIMQGYTSNDERREPHL